MSKDCCEQNSSDICSKNIWFFVSALLIGVVLGYGVSFIVPTSAVDSNNSKTNVLQDEKQNTTKDTSNKPSTTPTKNDMAALVDGQYIKGNEDAKVTIVEFADFECPACVYFYTNTYKDLMKNYVDTGKVKYVFRNFPLNMHKNAMPAAIAAECAGEQGKFYEMHDKLFENQKEYKTQTDINAFFTELAGEIGADKNKFSTCLVSQKAKDEVASDMEVMQNTGMKLATPSFVINGKGTSGALSIDAFGELIEEALKNS